MTDARPSAEVQVRSQVIPLGICGGQSEVALGRVFLRALLSSSLIPRVLHTIYHLPQSVCDLRTLFEKLTVP